MKTLVIMRGLPGSGKSTYIQDQYMTGESVLINTMVCSADQFFMKDGQYCFNPKLLKQAHETCKFNAATAMQKGVELVIIDNTNTQKWEYEDYLHMAAKHGYDVRIQVVGNTTDLELYAKRNTHGVPLTALQRMAARWEA